jgi:hypothetical protein
MQYARQVVKCFIQTSPREVAKWPEVFYLALIEQLGSVFPGARPTNEVKCRVIADTKISIKFLKRRQNFILHVFANINEVCV